MQSSKLCNLTSSCSNFAFHSSDRIDTCYIAPRVREHRRLPHISAIHVFNANLSNIIYAYAWAFIYTTTRDLLRKLRAWFGRLPTHSSSSAFLLPAIDSP